MADVNSEMSALEVFRLIGKEFEMIEDEELEKFFAMYSVQISSRRFGHLYNQALAYLTAHNLKMAGYGKDEDNLGTMATALRVASASEGNTSVSFSTNQATNLQPDAEYALTPYGLQYLSLRRLVIVPIINAGEGPCRY